MPDAAQILKNSSPPTLGIFQSLKIRSGRGLSQQLDSCCPVIGLQNMIPTRAQNLSQCFPRRFASSSTMRIVVCHGQKS